MDSHRRSMIIDIKDLQRKVKIDKRVVRQCARQVLRALGEEGAELSLLLVTDDYIKRLNQKYRKVNSETDVLAFPMRGDAGLASPGPILGDVVISVETAQREARKRNTSIKKEIFLYLIHGILHLLGYDDQSAKARKEMHSRENKLLKSL